jgi:hypothetical protein
VPKAPPQTKDQSIACKEKGNEYFQQKLYDQAIQEYSKAIVRYWDLQQG